VHCASQYSSLADDSAVYQQYIAVELSTVTAL